MDGWCWMGWLTFGNVHGVSGETGALPDETAFFGEEGWDFAADELVGDGFVGVRVQLGGVSVLYGLYVIDGLSLMHTLLVLDISQVRLRAPS